MSNQWLRLWHDMPTDPKWRTVARVAKQPITNVISVYVHMLVCASTATERGRTQGWSSEDVASSLDLETEQVVAILDAMQGRVIEGDALSGWDRRQPKREDDSALRAKEWRERKKEERERSQQNGEERKRSLDKDTDTSVDKGTRVNEIFDWLEKVINSTTPLFSSPIAAWLAWGADFELDIKPVATRWKKKNPVKTMNSLEWLDDDISASIQKRLKPMPENTNQSGGSNASSQRRSGNFSGNAGGGGASKTDRAKAAVMRAAVAGGYAPSGQPGEAGTGDDAVPVFSSVESVG